MKEYEEKSRKTYNQRADGYDKTLDGKFTKKFKELLLEEISIETNSVMLDVACGNGTFLEMVSNEHDIKGYGIDISEIMIENAKKKCSDMTFKIGSCEDTKFESQMFDVVTVCASYHHFPDTVAFAEEINRILKPKGLLYIAEVYLPSIVRAIVNPFVPLLKSGDVKFYSLQEIQNNFTKYDFKMMNFIKKGYIQIIELQKQ